MNLIVEIEHFEHFESLEANVDLRFSANLN